MYQSRDPGIRTIRARKGLRLYGMGLGILVLDDVYPGFPGDVRNASAYPFPIQFEIVEGIDIQKLVVDEDKSPCLEPVLKAANKLERLGCRAIAGECGYFAYFQREVAAAVSIPAFMSSLLSGSVSPAASRTGSGGGHPDVRCEPPDRSSSRIRRHYAWQQLRDRWGNG